MITRLVLFGATGDLAGRFLLPALARCVADGQLPEDLRVVGAAPQDEDDEGFRASVARRLAEHAADVPEGVRREVLGRLRYRRVDLDDADTVAAAVRAAADGDDGRPAPVVAYLALPPGLFPVALRALGRTDLPAGSRIAVEKPFGEDLQGAVALNALLAEVTGGDAGAVFRTDHALAMPGVQDLLAQRAPGGDLAGVEGGAGVEQVDLLWEEVLGLEGRADFYDRAGALKDILQNHLLQLMVLAAMELPPLNDDAALHEAKLALLRAVRPPSGLALSQWTRRARYTAGQLAGGGEPGRTVPDYAAEDGVDPAGGTETHAEVVLEVDAPRWAGTRFVLRSGKALAAGRKGVLVHLRAGAPTPRGGGDGSGRRVWIDLDGPAGDPRVSAERSAYSRVLVDVLSGGSRLSVSAEESEQAWRVVAPVVDAWARGAVPLEEYPAGSSGPALLGE